MKISEVAKRAGLSVDTLRFYEKIGLLDSTHYTRGENNYRAYDESVLVRLELIRHGQAAGFTLAEIGEVVAAWEADQVSPAQKIAYFEGKLSEIETQIARLQRIHDYLNLKLERFKEAQCLTGTRPAPERLAENA
ncbi:MAG: MerR family transcriptional regulator [bacterium]|nr:MerR family transcriptional regulator [bacterium]